MKMFRAYRERQYTRDHKRGFDYAAGCLLRAEDVAAEVERLTDQAGTSAAFLGVTDGFDQGIYYALRLHAQKYD